MAITEARFELRLPDSLKTEAEKLAARRGLTLASLIRMLLARETNWKGDLD